MAANSKGSALVGRLGKRFINQIQICGSARLPTSSSRAARGYSSAVYDKEVDDQVRPAVVPDHMIPPGSDGSKYWAPHPRTGVFGPAAEQNAAAGDTAAPPETSSSVLDQTAWFRPLEDVTVDKPSCH